MGLGHLPFPLPLGADIVSVAPHRLGQLGPRTPAWAPPASFPVIGRLSPLPTYYRLCSGRFRFSLL